MNDRPHWATVCTHEALLCRASLLQTIRTYFQQQQVLEVETPVLSTYANTDPFIDSFHCHGDAAGHCDYYLHTSPEFFMKRMLCSGSGDIFQICKVFRRSESGRKHHPEFSLLEWYRIGIDEHQLMQQIQQMLSYILKNIDFPIAIPGAISFKKYSYQYCFEKYTGINPHQTNSKCLQQLAQHKNIHTHLNEDDTLDRWLELLFHHLVEPHISGCLEQPEFCFVYDYPASQAALARIENNTEGSTIARRFELYGGGLELANGFYELNDANIQRSRFAAENKTRLELGKKPVPVDELLLLALEHGLPTCSGVALGLDRLLMILLQKNHIHEVLGFI